MSSFGLTSLAVLGTEYRVPSTYQVPDARYQVFDAGGVE